MAQEQKDIRLSNSYDDVPYPSYPFRETHPDRLSAVAKLFGMNPPLASRCRVLELGCASGGNLIPMADALPNSKFVGIDASGHEVDEGLAAIKAVGLKNVELKHMSIMDVDKKFGEFDYIICHGVYSWVPPDVQEKILVICGENLSEHGVAYVSYNTLPGWRMRGMIRDMMLYHSKKFPAPADRVQQSRALLKFLSESVPTENSAYGILLKSELDTLQKCTDAYLFHDHLEEHNEPLYFHQFMDRVGKADLQYVGDAELEMMWSGNFSSDVEQMLQQVSNDVIASEQYMDFLRNRMFRKSLLARSGQVIDRLLNPERLDGMYIAANLEPTNPEFDIKSTERETFHLAGRRNLTTGDPIMKAAVVVLRECWPEPLPFEKLLTAARARLASESVQDPARVAADRQVLSGDLLKCVVAGMIELQPRPADFVARVSSKPKATTLGRKHAENGPVVTNLRHQNIRLSDIDRHVLKNLDGKRDRNSLVKLLVKLSSEGELVVQQDGEPVKDDERAKTIIADALEESLKRLAEHALLQA